MSHFDLYNIFSTKKFLINDRLPQMLVDRFWDNSSNLKLISSVHDFKNSVGENPGGKII